MAIRPVTQTHTHLTSLVDRQIGVAYPIVKKVYDYLDQIGYLVAVYESGRSRDVEFQLDGPAQEVQWRYKGDADWTLLFRVSDIYGADISELRAATENLHNQAQGVVADIEQFKDEVSAELLTVSNDVDVLNVRVDAANQLVDDASARLADAADLIANISSLVLQAEGFKDSAEVAADSAAQTLAQTKLALGAANTAASSAQTYRNQSQQYSTEASGYATQTQGYSQAVEAKFIEISNMAMDILNDSIATQIYKNAAEQAANAAATSEQNSVAAANTASKLNLGPHATEPATDNQGQPLLVGATYYDTTLGKWRVWKGAAWGDGISAVAGVSSLNGLTGDVTLAKADVGLDNVDNTKDADKPVSGPQAIALAGKVDKVAGKGLSTEDFTTSYKEVLDILPGALAGKEAAGSAAAAVSAHTSAPDPHPQYTTAADAALAAPVQSVAGKTGAVTLAKADVGLGNVDNTSDADKPISTATAAALAEKAGASELAALSTSIQESMNPRITAVENATAANASALAGKAPMVHTHKIADITDFNPAAYMPKSGGTFTGAVSFNGLSTNTVAAVGSNSITYTATKHIFSGELEGTFKGNVTGNLSGNAATANSAAKLTTARTINGVAFDGSQNITINAADPTKMPLAGGTFTGPVYTGPGWTVRMAGNVWLGDYSANMFGIRAVTTDGYAGVQFCGTNNEDYGNIIGTPDRIQFNKTLAPVGSIPMRMINGNRAALIHHTGTELHFMATDAGAEWGGFWNSLRPLYYSLVTGKVSMGHGVDVTGGNVLVGDGYHVLSTGNVIAYYSDKRLKKDIRPVTDALDIVRSLTAYRYRANAVAASYGYDSSKDEVGLLAQDVQAVLPEVVERAPFDTAHDGSSKSGENYLTLKYERLVPVLLQAIKELEARVRALEEA